MAQKKNETIQAADDQFISSMEEANFQGLFIDTFWKQYEQFSERGRQFRENREDAYLKAFKEVIKFNKQYRKSLENFYEQSKKTNKEVFDGMLNRFQLVKEEAIEQAMVASEQEELLNQFNNVSKQVEKLALTPIKSMFQIFDQFENNLEKSAESSMTFARESRNAWLQVKKEYVKLVKNTHYQIVDRSKSGFKELVKTR